MSEIDAMRRALEAAKAVIRWYEMDHERSSYDEDDIPEDLREVEDEYEAALKAVAKQFPEGR